MYGDSAIKEKEKEKEEKKETAELESGSAGQQDRRPAGGKIFRRAAPDTPLRLRLWLAPKRQCISRTSA